MPVDSASVGADFRTIAFDAQHQQIFAAWFDRDRVDILSAADYHLIASITVPSPSSLDISPDGSTLAVGTSSSHILFFDTSTFAEVNDVVLPQTALGVTAFLYTANGNAFVRAAEGLSTGGGITGYWDHNSNSFTVLSDALSRSGPGIYQTNGPITRSDDYTRIILGDATSGGAVQIIDANTTQILQQFGYGGYIMGVAANKGASRYAICVQPAGEANLLIILDSSFNEIFQDAAGCGAMVFSPDGSALYREASVNGVAYLQSLDMNSFATRNTEDYFSHVSGAFTPHWEAADGTGIVYGTNLAESPGSSLNVYSAIFMAVDTTTASTGGAPGISDPIRIVRVIDNIGSPQGGDLIRLLCSGVGNVGASAISVKIAGNPASDLSIDLPGVNENLQNLRWVTVKTPAGTPGLADVTLNVGSTSDTAVQAFQYAQTSKIFPFSTSPNYLAYDSVHQKLYAAHKDQVEVIDPIAQQVLTPLAPVSGKLTNSQFAGISVSPDGSHLYICDSGANLIHVLDLNNPGTGMSIDPGNALGVGAISPARVFETTTGELFGADVNGRLFRIEVSTGSGQWFTDQFGNSLGGNLWNSTNKGQFVLIGSGGLITGGIGLWNANTSEYMTSLNETEGFVEAAANEDGTTIAVGGSTPGIQVGDPEIVDFDLDTIGFIAERFDTGMPNGTPSFFLHPSGALLYKAGVSAVGGSVEIDDVQKWQAVASVTFPEPFLTSYTPLTDHMLTMNDTGRYLFGVTKSGITMLSLNTLPLSIGHLQPSFGQPGGGDTVTIRGSGFQSGAVVTFGNVQAATTFVDESTLTAVVPALPSGWQSVTVNNQNGNSYSVGGVFQVLAAQPTPALTGFVPSAGVISLDREPVTVTITGSGFADYDWVEVNGKRIQNAFIDSTQMGATIPVELTAQTGSVPLTVVSPYTGPSNSLAVPLVNAVPVIHYILPGSLATGSPDSRLSLYGVNFVSGSVVQWNGQPLSTQVVGGMTNAGDELLIATVPSSLLTNSGTPTVTITNPAPGGGTSNALGFDVSPAHPAVSYPSSVDFGTNLIGVSATKIVQLTNLGSANYTISSISISSGPFSVQGNTCNNIGFVLGFSTCNVTFQFSPASGTSSATITIVDNVTGSPHSIPITGTGTQTLIPSASITYIDSLDKTISATVYGKATVGGGSVPATAWVEYGTDPNLSTFSKSDSWTFVGDSGPYGGTNGPVTGLNPGTTYAARLVVQTAGGIGKSTIKLFATMPAWPWVTFLLPPGASSSATINAGQTATYNLTAWDGGNGYTGTATFSCTQGLPSGATCAVTPSSPTIGLNGTLLTVTITTTAPTSASSLQRLGGLAWAICFALVFSTRTFTKRPRTVSLLLFVAALTILFPGCGGGGSNSSSGSGGHTVAGTPSGTALVTVTGTTGGVQNSFLLTLNVK